MREFLIDLLEPYPVFLLVMVTMVVVRFWRGRETRRRQLLAAIPLVALALISLQPIEYVLLGTLEWQNKPLVTRPKRIQAIVVLASIARPPNSWRLRPELDDRSISRCVCANALYHHGAGCPVVVSGGAPGESGIPCATVMRDFLLELGVNSADLIVEAVSRTTYENAVECCKLLEARGITDIVLVTDAIHMVRAAACFRHLGLQVVPAACHHEATSISFTVADLIPEPNSAKNCQRVWHEWVGLAWYWIQGRI
jgi:uncharacterized SAM-binding protein YcdF (DUF218 family)